MTKMLTLAAALLVGTAVGAHTEDLSPDQMKEMIQVKNSGIENLKKSRHDCQNFKEVKNRDACRASYEVVILRRETEKAILNLWLAGKKLDPMAQRIVLEEVMSQFEFYQMNDGTSNMADRVQKAFDTRRP